jgi:hypothetical protein
VSATPHVRGPRASTLSRLAQLIILLTLGVLAIALVAAFARPAAAGPAKGGIVDQRLETGSADGLSWFDLTLDDIPDLAAEMGADDRLGAEWTRVLVHWSRLQPVAPGKPLAGDVAPRDGFDDAYVAELDKVVGSLRAQGVSVILTGIDVPRWASDRRYWSHNEWDPDVVMKIDSKLVRTEFTQFATYLARHFRPMDVRHFEVWNEPNLGSGIFPQRGGGTPTGLKVYVKMLKAFWTGARRGYSSSVVIAGGTAPRGSNNQYSTSPQTFAKYLMDNKAGKYFNAYSHHPYTPSGSRNASPDQPPNNPSRCVTLGNLSVLLKLAPRKPFYLTEFAYNTQDSKLFGLTVSREEQAQYLTKGYQMVQGNSRVKALIWYLVPDWQPVPATPLHGAYCGLIGTDLLRKPAWYAFAGGNSVALDQPAPVTTGTPFALTGTLAGKVAVDAGQKLILQSRPSGGSTWAAVGAPQLSLAAGAFSFEVTQSQATEYRVLWDGVAVQSLPVTVQMVTP